LAIALHDGRRKPLPSVELNRGGSWIQRQISRDGITSQSGGLSEPKNGEYQFEDATTSLNKVVSLRPIRSTIPFVSANG
jgi:hypothetical protein